MEQNRLYSQNAINIIHCDLDAFYASVEQRDNPSLRGKAVIVGGKPRSRGVVATCSYEARKFGVRSAMPLAQAYRLCPQAVFLPVSMNRYQEASRKVFSIMSEYTPVIEILSIDEAFLDVSSSLSLLGSPENIGLTIKQRVLKELNLPISVGISYNKYLAKLASELDKPDGFRIIRPDEAISLLRQLPVSRLWGVGEKTRNELERLGLYYIGDIQDLPADWLEEKLGSAGKLFWELARGIDPRPVKPGRERKSLGRETTFAQDTSDLSYLQNILTGFTVELCQRLRRAGLESSTVTVKMRYSNFKTITRSKSISPGNSEQLIGKTAINILHQHYHGQLPLRLIGLSLSNLSPAPKLEQGNLFDDNCSCDNNKEIDRLLDNIRERFGPEIIGRANSLPTSKREK
jgi:DNA polymerase-4